MKTEQEQIEELTQFMLESSDSANVEPVFEYEKGAFNRGCYLESVEDEE